MTTYMELFVGCAGDGNGISWGLEFTVKFGAAPGPPAVVRSSKTIGFRGTAV